MTEISTILFDLDGTLYEDPAVYDRYARELAAFLPSGTARHYLSHWERARTGRDTARVGMGYDAERDCLFRYARGRIVSLVDWEGVETPVTSDTNEDPERPVGPPIEVPIFGHNRRNIGDLWAMADVLAMHYGVPRASRSAAFMATRAFMATDAFQLHLPPGMKTCLSSLRSAGLTLVAMSNSPVASVHDVFDELGIRPYFSTIVGDAGKPVGLSTWLSGVADPNRLLSVGDNYVNDIEPALAAGAKALYIDRHATALGSEYECCAHVPSIEAAIGYLGDLVHSRV
jgi:FMN phosphatase YigB (HAD superfamily)